MLGQARGQWWRCGGSDVSELGQRNCRVQLELSRHGDSQLVYGRHANTTGLLRPARQLRDMAEHAARIWQPCATIGRKGAA
jgi:hypothetical protein